MKRSTLSRRSPLKRKTRMRPRRATPRRSGRVRDREYLEVVRGMPCCLRVLGECNGDVQAHHAGKRPMGRKADDDTAVPLCSWHHEAVHSVWGTAAARPWMDRAIEQTRIWVRARLGRAA